MEKVYTCNICKCIKRPDDVNGFWFETNETDPRMIAPENTENVHICKKCQLQLGLALRKQAEEYTC